MKELVLAFFGLALIASIATASTTMADEERLPRKVGRFEFERSGETAPVWHYSPSNAKPNTPILIVLHGVNRDARRYLSD